MKSLTKKEVDKMTIKDQLKTISVGTALITTLSVLPATAKQKPKLNFGFNTLENALTDAKDVRTRLYTNMNLTAGNLYLGYHGLNETNNLGKGYVFGRNSLIVGQKGKGTKGIVVIKANKQGIFDKKIGIRNTSLVEKLGGYGFIDVTADKDAGNITAFYGKPLGKGASLEILQAVEMPFKGKLAPYTEIQLNKDLTKKLTAFCRAEIPDFDPKKAIYLTGFGVKL